MCVGGGYGGGVWVVGFRVAGCVGFRVGFRVVGFRVEVCRLWGCGEGGYVGCKSVRSCFKLFKASPFRGKDQRAE